MKQSCRILRAWFSLFSTLQKILKKQQQTKTKKISTKQTIINDSLNTCGVYLKKWAFQRDIYWVEWGFYHEKRFFLDRALFLTSKIIFASLQITFSRKLIPLENPPVTASTFTNSCSRKKLTERLLYFSFWREELVVWEVYQKIFVSHVAFI